MSCVPKERYEATIVAVMAAAKAAKAEGEPYRFVDIVGFYEPDLGRRVSEATGYTLFTFGVGRGTGEYSGVPAYLVRDGEALRDLLDTTGYWVSEGLRSHQHMFAPCPWQEGDAKGVLTPRSVGVSR